MATPVFDVDLRWVLDGMDRRRRRSRQRLPGPSDLGTCRRRVAYKLSRQKPDNYGSKAKAIQGTLLHKGTLAALRTAHGGYIEVKVERPGVLAGSVDWLRYDPLGLAVVNDVKTTGKDNHDTVVRGPVSLNHDFQLHVYADLLRRGELGAREKRLAREPVEVVDIEVLYLCRDDGRCDSRRKPFEQARADEAWAWLAEVRERLEVDGLRMVPRDLPGPDRSPICAGCPFARDCWAWDPETEQRGPIELGAPELEQWAVRYDKAKAAEAAAKRDKELARAHLDGQPPMKWESGWMLRWNGGTTKTVQVPDTDAMIAQFNAAGLPVPMRTVDKTSPLSISVLPPKAPR